jgi:hypothetical protein
MTSFLLLVREEHWLLLFQQEGAQVVEVHLQENWLLLFQQEGTQVFEVHLQESM